MAKATDSFSTGDAVRITGVSFRNIDYWARTKFIVPSIAEAQGTGTERRYSFSDLLALRVARELREAGVSTQSLRRVVEFLRTREGLDPATRGVPPDRHRHRCSGSDQPREDNERSANAGPDFLRLRLRSRANRGRDEAGNRDQRTKASRSRVGLPTRSQGPCNAARRLKASAGNRQIPGPPFGSSSTAGNLVPSNVGNQPAPASLRTIPILSDFLSQ